MNIIEIKTLEEPGIQMFGSLTEAQLRSKAAPGEAVFIVESPKVIRVALDAGMQPVALLCERRHIEGDARDIVERLPDDVPVYTGQRDLLARLTGYTLTRGVLCAMRRPQPKSLDEILRGTEGTASRIVVIHSVCDTTNIGAIFRSAAALGIDAVLLTPDSCDPLNRRAVRVSMGSVFLVPWAALPAPSHLPQLVETAPSCLPQPGETAPSCLPQPGEVAPHGDSTRETSPSWGRQEGAGAEAWASVLHRFGFKTVAMALTDQSVPLDDPALKAEQRLALIMGTEGDGLPHSVIAQADYTVRIPMHHGVDSLNVAAAAAVAFWELRRH